MNPPISLSAVFTELISTCSFSSCDFDSDNKHKQISVKASAEAKKRVPRDHIQSLLKSINQSVRKIGANAVLTKDILANLLSISQFRVDLLSLLVGTSHIRLLVLVTTLTNSRGVSQRGCISVQLSYYHLIGLIL